MYEGISIMSRTGIAICTAVVTGNTAADDSTSISRESVYKISHSLERKICNRDPGNDKTNIREEVHGKSKLTETVKGKTGEGQNQGYILIIFFDIKRIVYKEFILAGQTVNSAYSCDYYGDCTKKCEDFTPNFGDKRTGCCITTLPF
jgi:hypothetical protein